MAVGQGALMSGFSYLAVGRETALGTYNTCTAALDFISSSIKTTKERKIIEQIERSRTYSKGMSLSKKIEGEVEFYYQPQMDSCNFLLQNAFGGTITSATATGETTGAGAASAMQHTFALGNMDQSYPSLCLNIRKGDSAAAKTFQYSGVRVNEIMYTAEIDEAIKCSVGFVCMDSTQVSNDVSSALGVTASSVLSFVDGRVSVESTFASLTSSSIWHVVSAEFGWSNNLKADNDSRRIGTDTLVVLPPGMMTFNLKLKIRFDTTTAYAAMMNATQLACQLQFQGPTMSGSAIRQSLRLDFPKVFLNDAGDPEIGGPDEILMSEVDFQVLRDDSSAGGYALQGYVINQRSSYA